MPRTLRDLNAARQAVLETLRRVAPEVSPGDLDSTKPLRDQVDLGSLDWMNFLSALQDDLGVEISETDRVRLVTLDDLCTYLRAKTERAPSVPPG